MPIAIDLRKENGEILASLHESWDEGLTLPILDPGEFPMLGHVDAYGDTIFNRSQMHVVIAEIDRLVDSSTLTEKQAEFLLKVKALCAEGLRRPHRFLWFLGD